MESIRPTTPVTGFRFGQDALLRYALFLIIGISLLRKLFDADVWWHMVVGREVMRQMQIPTQEFYILPRMGEPGEFHEWGFGVFYYLINNYSGYIGMAVINAAIGCGILCFLHFATRDGKKPELWLSLPAMALVLWAIEQRMNFRPETFLYLFLAAEIFLLERYLLHKKLIWLIPLPLLSCLLSQGHPSTIFLMAVFGIYALQAWLTSREKAKTAGTLALVMLSMAGAGSLNPYGVHQLLIPFSYVFSSDELIQSLTEYLPVLQTEYATHFLVTAIAGGIAIIFTPQRRVVDILLYLLFFVLAFRYARNMALLAIVAYVPISHALYYWIPRFAKAGARLHLAVLCSVLVMAGSIASTMSKAEWGVGIYEENTPYKSAPVIAQLAPQGNILNFYHLGSYLAWILDRPVFIDGKNYGVNRAVELHNAIFSAVPDWQKAVDTFNIQAIVTPATLSFSGQIIPLVPILGVDPNWVLVGQEKSGLLFVRKGNQQGAAVLPQDAIWHQAIEELESTMEFYPDSKETYLSLAAAYGHLGDADKQRFYAEKYTTLSSVRGEQ